MTAQVDALDEELDTLDNAGAAPYDDLSDRAVIERSLAVNLFGTHTA